MLKSLGRKFWDFCPKYNRKIVKSGFYVSRMFLCGIFFPEITTHVFVILGLRTKSFRTFIKLFSTIFETAVYVSTDKFCGKKIFISTGFWAKIFYLFSIKVREGFQNCILHVQGKVLRKINVCSGKQKILFSFFLVFLPKTYRKTC